LASSAKTPFEYAGPGSAPIVAEGSLVAMAGCCGSLIVKGLFYPAMNELPITTGRRGFDSKSLLWGDLERGVEDEDDDEFEDDSNPSEARQWSVQSGN